MAHSTLWRRWILVWLVPAMVAGCASTAPKTGPAEDHTQVGVASFYAHRFHGRRTASGERYDEVKMTAAHRSLPHGTRVRVTNLENGRKVVVRINDRGPFSRKRVIDLSYAAAETLQFIRQGLTRVRIEVLAQAD